MLEQLGIDKLLQNLKKSLTNNSSLILTLGVAVIAMITTCFAFILAIANREDLAVTPNEQIKSTSAQVKSETSGKIINVEVADTEQERARGLQNRFSLDPDSGMLFVFPTPRLTSFWMDQTYIPLDMIFINSEGIVVKVVENAEPLRKDLSYSSTQPVQFVLEVPGGTSKDSGFIVGTKVLILNT